MLHLWRWFFMLDYKDLISVIVPVYNAQKYIEKSIQSVLNQTYCNWELILVDDGSMDGSYDICNMYSRRERRITCIHTDNLGRVHARKTGIQIAKGSVIAFLDSDDWLEPDALQKMYSEMCNNRADCVIAGYIETYVDGEKVVLNTMPQGVYNMKQLQEVFFPNMLCYSDFCELGIQPFLWNKLFKRKIIEPYIEETDERIVIGEDVVSVFPALLNATTISVVGSAYYHYCLHEGSTMQSYRAEKDEIENIYLQYTSLERFFSAVNRNTNLESQLKHYTIHHVMVRALPYLFRNIKSARNLVLGGISIDSRIILYGAGAYGRAVFNLLKENGENQISAWCDRDYRKYQAMQLPVVSVGEALQNEYDFVYVAVMCQETYEKIRNTLIGAGVEAQKIAWMDAEGLANLKMDEVIDIDCSKI